MSGPDPGGLGLTWDKQAEAERLSWGLLYTGRITVTAEHHSERPLLGDQQEPELEQELLPGQLRLRHAGSGAGFLFQWQTRLFCPGEQGFVVDRAWLSVCLLCTHSYFWKF